MKQHTTQMGGYTTEIRVAAQICTLLNNRYGFRVSRTNNTGAFDAKDAEEEIIDLYHAIASGQFSKDHFRASVSEILNRSFRKTPSQIKGWPDITGFDSRGKFGGIEIKLGNDQMSVEQSLFKKEVLSVGGWYYEVRSFELFSRTFADKYQHNHIPINKPLLPGLKESRTGLTGKKQQIQLWQTS